MRLKVASYNMRKAIGTDRRRNPERILQVLRENCFCYLHGNSVGGTNPALLEAMAGCPPQQELIIEIQI